MHYHTGISIIKHYSLGIYWTRSMWQCELVLTLWIRLGKFSIEKLKCPCLPESYRSISTDLHIIKDLHIIWSSLLFYKWMLLVNIRAFVLEMWNMHIKVHKAGVHVTGFLPSEHQQETSSHIKKRALTAPLWLLQAYSHQPLCVLWTRQIGFDLFWTL